MDATGPVLFVLEIVYTITDPPIMFVRRFVPPLRLGAVALDTSFLIVLVAVYLLRSRARARLRSDPAGPRPRGPLRATSARVGVR